MTDAHDAELHASATRLLNGLTASGRAGGVFSVAGPPAVGKSRTLELVRQQMSEAALIDCVGLRADEVILQVLDVCGVQRPHSVAKEDLDALVKRIRGDHTVLLANVQWAGTLRTTDEPGRIKRAAFRMGRAKRSRLRLALETAEPESAQADAPPPLIRLGTGSQFFSDPEELAPEIHALALAEYPVVPVAAWSVLCDSMGLITAPADLQRFPDRYPGLLKWVPNDAITGPGVAFTHEGIAHALRRSYQADTGQAHLTVRQLLSEQLIAHTHPDGWANGDPLARYAAHGLAAHAAASGSLQEVLEDRRVLALLEPSAVMEAYRAAFGRDIPPDTMAASLRYGELSGMEPMRQGEWAAWLHHFAVSHGDQEAADAVLASEVTLEWRTLWSDLRPAGAFLEESLSRRPTGITRLIATEHMAAATNELRGTSWAWELRSGRPHESAETSDQAAEARRMVNTSHGWRPAPDESQGMFIPRCPRDIRAAARIGNLAVLGGDRGVFAVEILEREPEHEAPPWHGVPLLDAYERGVAARPLPEALREPSAAQLAEVFGNDSVFRPAESDIPETLRGTEAAQWLVEHGLPTVELLTLNTRGLCTQGLREIPPPDELQDSSNQRSGPYFAVGELLGGDVVLDGGTGQVLCTSDAVEDHLAGSSLRQFVTMFHLVGRYHLLLSESLTVDKLEADAELQSWVSEIDPVTASGEIWDTLLNDPEIEP
ncbi:SUKH-4 family immunity protein [Streptomyces sp. NPDC048612]|uniref:SUKH-4 family immunity protein n=1 Tax=Streptomyces sp. NPDC048612 TaxID=3365579 RepID=UPI00371BA6EA